MKQVFDLLKENFVMTVATSSNDKPRASIVEYYLVDNAIIFGTDAESIKATNLKNNNRISFSINNLPKFVTIDGKVIEPTEAEINDYTTQLLQKHPEFKELIEKNIFHAVAYFKVEIETAYYNDYSNGTTPTQIIKS